MTPAGFVARRKERKPHLYCPRPGCLWLTGDGAFCPKHGGPMHTTERRLRANRLSRGESS